MTGHTRRTSYILIRYTEYNELNGPLIGNMSCRIRPSVTFICKSDHYNDNRFCQMLTLNETIENSLTPTYLSVPCPNFKIRYSVSNQLKYINIMMYMIMDHWNTLIWEANDREAEMVLLVKCC